MASIEERVRDLIVEQLGVNADQVTDKASFVDDLGAESIDFLDIVFRLEKNFGVKIPRGELFPEGLAADASLVTDGVVNADGIAALRQKLPHADVDGFAKDPKVENIQSMFTVDMIINFIENKLKDSV